jgi:hypothetical protein
MDAWKVFPSLRVIYKREKGLKETSFFGLMQKAVGGDKVGWLTDVNQDVAQS